MLYAIICHDKPDHLELRMKIRPRHLAYLQSLGDRLKFAGPFTDEESRPNGSLLVVEAEDRTQAESIADGDPYTQEGLFRSCAIHPWIWTVNNPDKK